MTTLQFSINANVEKVGGNLIKVEGWDADFNDVKLLMSEEQFEEAKRMYLEEQNGEDVSGYCYFDVSEEFVNGTEVNCVFADDLWVDMCYDEDIYNDEDEN